MKKIIFLLLVFSFVFANQKICLNMIVKDESKGIRKCLESVKPFIDYWVIVDTGSTDGTQEIIKEYFKDVPGELHEQSWVDFAHNRNEALKLAKEKGDYLLFIDGDDILTFDPDFKKPTLDKDAYYITISYSGMNYARTSLVKSNLNWRWDGVVHEVLVCSDNTSNDTLSGVTMLILGKNRSPEEGRQKFLSDAKVLEEALEKEPHHTRYTFYLAQSYRDAGELEKAIQSYQKRVDLGGWDQEVFWSLYQIAILQEHQNCPEETVLKSYSKAFVYRPTRIEPLYRLAKHYRLKENYLLGYLISKQALEIPPTNDILFLESWIYDYDLLLEFSICAYWIEKYEEALIAGAKLIEKQTLPQNVRDCVERNLKFTTAKLLME